MKFIVAWLLFSMGILCLGVAIAVICLNWNLPHLFGEDLLATVSLEIMAAIGIYSCIMAIRMGEHK